MICARFSHKRTGLSQCSWGMRPAPTENGKEATQEDFSGLTGLRSALRRNGLLFEHPLPAQLGKLSRCSNKSGVVAHASVPVLDLLSYCAWIALAVQARCPPLASLSLLQVRWPKRRWPSSPCAL